MTKQHYHHPGKRTPWALCKICGLGRAAHEHSRKYVYIADAKRLETVKHRCPDCVSKDVKCRHRRRKAPANPV